MKYLWPNLLLLVTGAALGATPFGPGGESIKLPSSPPQIQSNAAPNQVFNGSFELPGTNPNGWNAASQQGWIGWNNLPTGKTPQDKQLIDLANQVLTRELVKDAPAGRVALRFNSQPLTTSMRQKLHNVNNKIRQMVKIPTVKTAGEKWELTFQYRGTANTRFYALLTPKAINASGAVKRVGKLISVPVTIGQNYRTFRKEFELPVNCNCIELDLMLYMWGEVTIDDVAIRPVTAQERLKVETFADRTDGRFALGENQVGLITFAFDHSGELHRENLELMLELPDGFELVDVRALFGRVRREGQRCYISLMNSTRDMLKNFYQYKPLAVMLQSSHQASKHCYPLRYQLQDGAWRGKMHEIQLQIIPAVSSRAPKHFKTAADFNQEVMLNDVGVKKLADFYQRHGFNSVHGVPYKPFYDLLKQNGITRYTENYYLCNGYRLGQAPKPKNCQFLQLNGQPYPRKVCPVEVYQQGPYFQQEIRGMLQRQLIDEDQTDHFMPNWEPFYLDSRGCFCNRCREEFIKYCAGKIPAADIRAAWPQDILKRYAPTWVKFRSYQHGRLVVTLEKTIAEIGRQHGRECHLIPEITIDGVLPKNFRSREQYAPTDYAYELPYLNIWGPYIWHDLDDYNEWYPAPHLESYVQSAEAVKFLQTHAPSPAAKLPQLYALPHGWQGRYWVTTPEAIALEFSSFFFQKWQGVFAYFFPRGYDYRYWSALARTNALIAEAEDFVNQGKACDDAVKIVPVTGLPQLYFDAHAEATSPELRQMSPVQYHAFKLNQRYLIGVGNFWKRGEHFFKLQVRNLPGGYQVRVPGASRGIFSAAELERGVLMQVGALRWQYIYLEPADSPVAAPLVTNAAMEKLLAKRRGTIARALHQEAQLYQKRFKAYDLSGVQPVASGKFRAQVQNSRIHVTTPQGTYQVNPLQGGGIVAPCLLGKPGFWWTVKKAVELNQPFTVKALTADDSGVTLNLERTLTAQDLAELAGLKLQLRYHFGATAIQVRAQLVNTKVDSVALAFRFKNQIPGTQFTFANRVTHPRNYQVALFRYGQSDGELDSICHFDQVHQVPQGAVQVGAYRLQCRGQLYGVVAWDGSGQDASTVEPVWAKQIVPPNSTVTYELTIQIQN